VCRRFSGRRRSQSRNRRTVRQFANHVWIGSPPSCKPRTKGLLSLSPALQRRGGLETGVNSFAGASGVPHGWAARVPRKHRSALLPASRPSGLQPLVVFAGERINQPPPVCPRPVATDIPARLPNNLLTAVCVLCIICINNLMVGHLLFWRKQTPSVCNADVNRQTRLGFFGREDRVTQTTERLAAIAARPMHASGRLKDRAVAERSRCGRTSPTRAPNTIALGQRADCPGYRACESLAGGVPISRYTYSTGGCGPRERCADRNLRALDAVR